MAIQFVPQPQPKILTAITVPTGGWQLKIYTTNIAQYDVANTVTLIAGDYFMAWDQQTDCFIYHFAKEVFEKIAVTLASAFGVVWIDADHKVNITFEGDHYAGNPQRDVKIAWTELDGETIGKILGFDVSADLELTGTDYPTTVADYPHAYGWYADADGTIADDMPEDAERVYSLQSKAPSGHVVTQYIGEAGVNVLGLQFVENTKMWSGGIGYTETATYPRTQNEPLECWWQEARQGKRFRVYRDGQFNTDRAVQTGTVTFATATRLDDNTKTWQTDPPRWVNRLAYQADIASAGGATNATVPGRWLVSAMVDSDTLTMVNPVGGGASPYQVLNGAQYWLFEQTYGTYVLDLEGMKDFKPQEIKEIDEWNITIPLLKYES
jgi:hypothetical protein